ncbi:MAG: hypothetical protein ACSHX8_08630 [Opitutaceae bacterium]
MFTLAQMQAPQLPELPEGPSLDRVRGPVEIPPFETWEIALFIGLGVFLSACIIWLIVAQIQKQRSKTQKTSAYESALSEIREAQAITESEPFTIRCSAALRLYFEDGLGIAATGRTSEEFIRSLKGNTRLDDNYQQQVAEFFAQCDAIKFAGHSADEAQRAALADCAEKLITGAERTKEESAQ